MKKIYYFLFILLGVFVLASCDEEYKHPAEFFELECLSHRNVEVSYKGYKGTICQDCGRLTTPGLDIPQYYTVEKKKNHRIVHVPGQEPSCTEVGWEEFDYCLDCNYSTFKVRHALGHDIVQVHSKKSDCVSEGNNNYFYCARCGFTNNKVVYPINPNEHDLVFKSFRWDHEYNAFAVYGCTRNDEHTQEFEAHVDMTIITESTCTQTGIIRYTATYGRNSQTIEVTSPSLGGHIGGEADCTNMAICERCGQKYGALDNDIHQYEFSSFELVYNDEGLICAYAVYKCKLNPEHIVKYEATITSETKEPGCVTLGKTIYTATYDGHSTTKEFNIPSLGGHIGGTATCSNLAICDRCEEEYGTLDSDNHNYIFDSFEFINEDVSTAKAYAIYKCKYNDSHIIKYQAELTKDIVDSTCAQTGLITYTASFNSYSATSTSIIPKKEHTGGTATCTNLAICQECGTEYGSLDPDNHNYEYAGFEWIYDNDQIIGANVIAKCSYNAEHIVKDIAELSSETIEPTCTKEGKIIYTANYYDVYTDTKEVIIESLGHIGGTADCTNLAICDRCHEEYGQYDEDAHEYVFFDFEYEKSYAEISARWYTPDPTPTGVKVCYAVYKCKLNPEHVIKYVADVTEEIIDPTCEDIGAKWFVASYYDASAGGTYSKRLFGLKTSDALGHTGGEATCTERAICTRCQNEYGNLLDHEFEYYETIDEIEYEKCLHCDEIRAKI